MFTGFLKENLQENANCNKLNPEGSAIMFWPWNSSEYNILQFTLEVMGESQGNLETRISVLQAAPQTSVSLIYSVTSVGKEQY